MATPSNSDTSYGPIFKHMSLWGHSYSKHHTFYKGKIEIQGERYIGRQCEDIGGMPPIG